MNFIRQITEEDMEDVYIRTTVREIEDNLNLARRRGIDKVSVPIDFPKDYSSEKQINLKSKILSYFESYNYIFSSYKNHLDIDFYLR